MASQIDFVSTPTPPEAPDAVRKRGPARAERRPARRPAARAERQQLDLFAPTAPEPPVPETGAGTAGVAARD